MRGHSSARASQWLRLFVQDCLEDDAVIPSAERSASGDRLVDDDAKGPQVASLVKRLAANLLGRHIRDCTRRGTRAGNRCIAGFRQSEIEEFYCPVARQDNVGGLHVTVNDVS